MRSRSDSFQFPALALTLCLLAVASSCDGGPVEIVLGTDLGSGDSAAKATTTSAPRAAPAPIRYDRDIRPILADRCFICHGPDPGKRKAELRLDNVEGATALRDGITPIAPGDTAHSELLRRIAYSDPDEVMPPPTSNKRAINEEERELLHRWIAEGAKYEPHWAFIAPVRPTVPASMSSKNPIDAFVRANLEAHQAKPSQPAEAQTLLRRAFLDLTGLPPTPEEQDQYLADTHSDKFERLVEKLLHEEPYVSRYAERMATPWLDAARYADTSGIHMDAGRSIWPWRDWVLAAYRDGMPFDQFVSEQLAGDLLPDATNAQRIASGFNRNHVTSDEGGAIAAEYLVEYAVDRTATTGSVFLGMTIGCARCHDHKFDPVSQDEFYRFYAYFDSIDEPGLYSQVPDSKRALEPFMDVPSEKDRTKIDALDKQLTVDRAALDEPDPNESSQRAKFIADLTGSAGLHWAASKNLSAVSAEGATMTLEGDGSVLASGKNPDFDEHTITLRTNERDLRVLALEALTDKSFVNNRVGRANNANAVLGSISVEAVSVKDPTKHETIVLRWAWADFEQQNGNFRVMNTIDAKPETGWAVDAHNREGGRVAMFLADKPFGFDGGTDVRVALGYRTMYAGHVFGRVRLSVGQISDAGLAVLPPAMTTWAMVGPFPATPAEAYDKDFGPEAKGALDLTLTFGEKKLGWKVRGDYLDGPRYNDLPADQNVTYLGRHLYAPAKRSYNVSLGSDDGFRLFIDGVDVGQQKIDRALSEDSNKIKFDVEAGLHEVALKIINTGGIGGFMWRTQPSEGQLAGDLMLALAPGDDTSILQRSSRIERAWRLAFSPSFRAKNEALEKSTKELADARANIPRTMVMKELAMQRETFVLTRGQYDHPDKTRKVERGVPAALGALPEGAPADRRGLAQWLVAPTHPLVARVAVNRMWEMLFGTGIVRSSEDFGLQGEWPSHPELLDWLAVEFRDNGWDVKRMLALIITSETYRQESKLRSEYAEHDPSNRWLSYFPRQRLTAEGIRDGALYTSGLLVEKFGGVSVKPYQPDGLWQEVAMPSSNTRLFERGMDTDLWRRSLYTYWKRACPPPALLTFDAPTREFCTIRRASTNTPLQALVLWNDEQYVEAARVLAERTLNLPAAGDNERIVDLVRRCTGRKPDSTESAKLNAALVAFRARFAAAVEDAKLLVEVGERMTDAKLDPIELAAWTMVTSAVLNLDATITKS